MNGLGESETALCEIMGCIGLGGWTLCLIAWLCRLKVRWL